MNDISISEDVDKYWPKNHALMYYMTMLSVLLERSESVKKKIADLKEQDE